MTPIDRIVYRRVLEQAHGVRLLARAIVAGGHIDAALDEIARAEAVGPILDPTAFMARAEAMREDEATLRAVRILGSLGGAPQSLTGEGTAPEPGSSSYSAGDSLRGPHAPSPVEHPVAFATDVEPVRNRPAAS